MHSEDQLFLVMMPNRVMYYKLNFGLIYDYILVWIYTTFFVQVSNNIRKIKDMINVNNCFYLTLSCHCIFQHSFWKLYLRLEGHYIHLYNISKKLCMRTKRVANVSVRARKLIITAKFPFRIINEQNISIYKTLAMFCVEFYCAIYIYI